MPPSTRPADEGRLIQLVYYGYVVGSAIARAVPERVAYALAHILGALAARVSRQRAQVERNLARITKEPAGSRQLDEIVVRAFQSYARYWLETFRLVREGRDFFLERVVCDGEDNLDGVLARGKGAVVAVGHLGNYDAGGAWLGATGRWLVTVVEVLRPRRLFEFFADHRSRLGMTIYPAQPGVSSRLVEAVEQGAVVAILGDRDLRGTGPEVEFFGEVATFPPGPASVAVRAGVPLLVAGVYGERFADGRRGWRCEISEPIELPSGDDAAVVHLTQEVARRLEGYIAKRPEEWHVFQPLWKSDRAKR